MEEAIAEFHALMPEFDKYLNTEPTTDANN
jgi:hypothetical protein